MRPVYHCPHRQSGLSLVELLVAMALSVTVMGGVVSALLVSKRNFISEQEMANLQENARYAIRMLSDEILMAGFTACSRSPLNVANSINGSSDNWYLSGTGIQGYEHEAGRATFPAEFRDDVRAGTDALVVRRGENDGLSVAGSHNPSSAVLPLNRSHSMKPGQVLVVSTADCQQLGIFQMSGPTNNNNNAVTVVHNTGNMSPGNCTKALSGSFDCNNAPAPNASGLSYPRGSRVMRLSSQAFYVGTSSVGDDIPALFAESMNLNTSTSSVFTAARELVQGVENMQLLYGLDLQDNDGLADIYLKANDAAMDWSRVVAVRLTLRMRSINPVYVADEAFAQFLDVSDSAGSDRFMRQVVSTTVQLRN